MASLTDSLTPRRAASELWLWHVRAGAFALVLGGAFGAGVLLGGGDGDPDGGEVTAEGQGTDPLALADARTEKLEEVRAALKLRFHDELVGPPRDVKDRAKPAAAETPKVAAAMAGEAQDPAARAREKALADQASPPERLDEDESVKAEDADEDVESIAAPREDQPDDKRRIAEALARVLGDDTPKWASDAQQEPAAPVAPVPKAGGAGRYHVQVAATPSEDGANTLVEKLKGQGFSALAVPVDLEDKGRIWRVRVGPFADRGAAEARVSEVREVAGLNGFVVSE